MANFKRLWALQLLALGLITVANGVVRSEECPYRLLWRNGALWAFETVICENGNCGGASSVVLVYDHSLNLNNLGCKTVSGNCVCRIPLNDYIARFEDPVIHQIPPNLAVSRTNRVKFLDTFNLKVDGTTDYFQCIEFTYYWNKTLSGIPKWDRENTLLIAVKLNAPPSGHDLADSVVYDDDQNPMMVILTRNGYTKNFNILRKGILGKED